MVKKYLFDHKRCLRDSMVRGELHDEVFERHDRAPTPKEYHKFCVHLASDFPDWVTGNARGYVRDIMGEE